MQHGNRNSPFNPPTHQQYSALRVMSAPQGFPQPVGPPQTPYQPYPQTQQYGPPNPQTQYQFAQGPSQHGFYPPGPQSQPSYSTPPPVAVTYANQPYSYPPNQPQNTFGPQQFGYAPPSQYIDPQPNSAQQYGPPQPQQYGPPLGPTPYQPQPVTYQEPQSNGYFNGNFPTAPPNFQGSVNQQWSSAPPSTWIAPPYQPQQPNYSGSNHPSGAPVFPHQQQHPRHSSQQINQRLSNENNQLQFPKDTQPMNSTSTAESKASSTVSTPQGERDTAATSAGKEANSRPGPAKAAEESKESEVIETQLFEWELEKIFKLPATHDIVALAQPLSHDFDLSPVPQLNPLGTCVSRYASKDNVKQFTSSIRDALDWPFRKEDPAFAELDFDSPLIPLREIPAWMEARDSNQSGAEDTLMHDTADASRKRPRFSPADGDQDNQIDSDVQDDLDNTSEKEDGQNPKKRQKTETIGEHVDEKAGTPEMTTKFYENRVGTPCLVTDDDAWAPQPGEGAEPVDPTEALLASLGVTGSPKPVDDSPLPPYQPLPEQLSPPISSSPSKKEPQTPISATPTNSQGKVAHTRRREGNLQGSHQKFKPTPPRLNTENRPPQFAPPGNAPSLNGLPMQPQISSLAQAPYQNGPSINSQYGHPQIGTSSNVNYGSNAMHGNEQYGNPCRTNNNSLSGPPHNGNSAYGNNMPGPQPNGNPMYAQGTSGVGCPQPDNNHNGLPKSLPYFNVSAQNAPYGPGPDPQNQQPQFASGLSQSNNSVGQQQPQYNSGPPNQLANGPQGNHNYSNQNNHQQYGSYTQNNTPVRQDSGYGSAGGFGSNDSAQNNFPVQQNPQAQSQQTKMYPPHQSSDGLPRNGNGMNGNQSTKGSMQSEIQSATSKENPIKQGNSPTVNIFSADSNLSDREDSPLSDNSKEILGLLETKKKKGPKRPAPIVEAAYSRRW
ncbi:hypothetical protein HYALB_00002316 [Hymenoscyphus albidus]|uniref:Uncharacterized protein n=1 Tax=Hymenoscyphus albidus TaxID=595503 RepID=A0A9N9LWR5_9HELO|nr:hypothetical protein HYALB_00002316 [Hymenoscyphus albidus]